MSQNERPFFLSFFFFLDICEKRGEKVYQQFPTGIYFYLQGYAYFILSIFQPVYIQTWILMRISTYLSQLEKHSCQKSSVPITHGCLNRRRTLKRKQLNAIQQSLHLLFHLLFIIFPLWCYKMAADKDGYSHRLLWHNIIAAPSYWPLILFCLLNNERFFKKSLKSIFSFCLLCMFNWSCRWFGQNMQYESFTTGQVIL